MVSTGSYVAKLENQSLLWRGSSNQELHYLTEVYNSSMEEKWVFESPTEEYSVHSEGIQFTGFGGKRKGSSKVAVRIRESSHSICDNKIIRGRTSYQSSKHNELDNQRGIPRTHVTQLLKLACYQCKAPDYRSVIRVRPLFTNSNLFRLTYSLHVHNIQLCLEELNMFVFVYICDICIGHLFAVAVSM